MRPKPNHGWKGFGRGPTSSTTYSLDPILENPGIGVQGLALWRKQVERLINWHLQFERSDEPARSAVLRGERAAAQGDSGALGGKGEGGQRGVKLQALAGVEGLGPGGLQPDAPAFLIAQHMQKLLVP